MTLSANFTSKSVFDVQGCRALTFALARLSCNLYDVKTSINQKKYSADWSKACSHLVSKL